MRLSRVLVAAALVVASLPRVATAAPARLTPRAVSLDLRAGQSRDVEYTLLLEPETPRETDVYVLVDTGASMRPLLPDVRRGLGTMLAQHAYRNLRWGVGEFRTTSVADWRDGLTYRALRRVGAIDQELARAVDRLGRDQASLPDLVPGQPAHTLALDEAVTGDGHWPYVGAGQQAGFRPDARKVVVVVTDSAFVADPTQPSRADTIAALRTAGVEVFGLAVGAAATGDLAAVASGTGSVADTTVDCGGGRRVAPGRPTACAVTPASIGGAVTGMLYERRTTHVTVSTRGTGVRRLEPRAWTVDRGLSSRLRFRLEAACAAGDAGRTHETDLSAWSGGALVARATVLVRCRAR